MVMVRVRVHSHKLKRSKYSTCAQNNSPCLTHSNQPLCQTSVSNLALSEAATVQLPPPVLSKAPGTVLSVATRAETSWRNFPSGCQGVACSALAQTQGRQAQGPVQAQGLAQAQGRQAQGQHTPSPGSCNLKTPRRCVRCPVTVILTVTLTVTQTPALTLALALALTTRRCVRCVLCSTVK